MQLTTCLHASVMSVFGMPYCVSVCVCVQHMHDLKLLAVPVCAVTCF